MEKLFLLNIDPFSEYILLADFSNYFYNVIYDLYFNLSYDLNMVKRSYGSLNLRNLVVDMAISSDNEISDSNDSASVSKQVRKKLKHSIPDKQIFLVDPNMVWFPIYRKKPDSDSDVGLDFFEFLKKYMINHRDLLLPGEINNLMLEQVVVRFNIQATWAGIDNLEFSETFNQVAFLSLAKSDNGWNFNRDPLFFAWYDPPWMTSF
jgi:hypothetical protein